ncbi:MAG: 2-polyprenyl-3-methyl-6-methoxy-1,4-benzoquinone monooxygenase [Mariprofundaceae bacterium]|nr:2-polyprenyl-3-methyl-6-methoxy-1,4-benzoquinone monooxygenase [Mariprofundaceae bacterium]
MSTNTHSSPDPSESTPFRRYSIADTLIGQLDHVLNNVFCEQASSRPYPADELPSDGLTPEPLSVQEKQTAAGLMRVNHAGEISAQALYQGQSLTARDPSLRGRLAQASIEESDHLNWCRRRLRELDAHPSRLDPFWYAGSFTLGMAAGLAGDRWNLGFLAETEYQVVRHLDAHLAALPEPDARSRAIVTQMKEDELGHAHLAEDLGAADLPPVVKGLMKLTSRVMTSLAERI